jgi:sulfide:quinone oxidoreductase
MSESRFRVVIAGGGVAGLETLMALRALTGDRAELALVAPKGEFVYSPLQVEAPFQVGRRRRVSLDVAARDAGAAFIAGEVEAVSPEGRSVVTSCADRLSYEALVLAAGAESKPAVQHAMTWDDRSGSEMVGGLMRDCEEGYVRSLAVVIPPGPGWPLRGYELALTITLQANGMGIDLATTVVVQEPSPLWVLGSRTVQAISRELTGAGIGVVSACRVEVEQGPPITVVAHPSEHRVEVDSVLALPTLHGRRIAGIPADVDGFIDVDDHCRVRGLSRVWAAGDGTAFPVKSGGFAAEQADVVAEDIAATAGADIEPRPFDPVLREHLAGLPAGRFLEQWLVQGDRALATHLPSAQLPVLTYLERDLAAGWRGDD